jgi:oxalate decarboxylase/phosphoglucose isomerase-like protein (cupin superfamily)
MNPISSGLGDADAETTQDICITGLAAPGAAIANAAELDYVISGRGRMIIFSPGDNVDTFEVGPREIVFIPSAYFHYIENVNASEDMQFAEVELFNCRKSLKD